MVDSSGSGLDAVAVNGADTDATARLCRSGVFSGPLAGNRGYVDAGDVLNDVFGTTSNQFTVAAWIRPTALGTAVTNHQTANCFIAKASDGNNDNLEMGVNPNGTIHVYIDSSGKDTYAEIGTAGDVPLDAWTFVALTYESGTTTVTINSTRYDAAAWSGGGNLDNAAGSEFTIGSSQHTDNYFEGYIDEVYVFDQALSADDINNLRQLSHNCPSCP